MLPEKVGVLAMGSHKERHGAALPPDTDAKLAVHVAEEAARRTGAKFIGVLFSAYEYPKIETGEHQSLDTVMGELRSALQSAKRLLGIEGVVIVNAHGGNKPVGERISELEQELGLKIVFNSVITDLEGPHAGTGELSMGAALGIMDPSKLTEHADFTRYPEVGFVGLTEAKRKYEWARRQAAEVTKLGVRASLFLGRALLECAIADVVNTIREM
jgi:2-amino-5-formylamino-6-ribosylaminopyrimidin-4(3H)-one 5'-monophosphate deformylase